MSVFVSGVHFPQNNHRRWRQNCWSDPKKLRRCNTNLLYITEASVVKLGLRIDIFVCHAFWTVNSVDAVSPLSSLCSETVLMSVDSTRFVVVHLYAFSCVFASLDCAMPLLPEWALSESRDPFWSPCHIFGSSEARVLKFFTQVSHRECLHWHDKIPPKWACLGLRWPKSYKKASIRWQDNARRQFQAGLKGDVGL